MPVVQKRTAAENKIDNRKDKDGCRDIEVLPGIFWMSEEGGANLLVDSRTDADRTIVHLHQDFEIEQVVPIQDGKSYHVRGNLAGEPSEFHMVYGRNRMLYAVGKAPQTDANGRAGQPFNPQMANYLYNSARVKS